MMAANISPFYFVHDVPSGWFENGRDPARWGYRAPPSSDSPARRVIGSVRDGARFPAVPILGGSAILIGRTLRPAPSMTTSYRLFRAIASTLLVGTASFAQTPTPPPDSS